MSLAITDFTTETLDGTGAFDVLMRGAKAHVVAEFDSNRIKGGEYSQVYLSTLQGVMDRSLEFLLTRDKLNIELEILAIAKEKAEIEKETAAAQLLLVNAQVAKTDAEKLLVDAEVLKADADKLRIDAQTDLLLQQKLNAVTEETVLKAQECKLRAEFDLIMEQINKVASETGLLDQKKLTEAAQINGAGVGVDSVIGKQIALYGAQTNGFSRDAEQKAAKILVETWAVRRTTDDATQANTDNSLDDAAIGRVVDKLLTGVNA